MLMLRSLVRPSLTLIRLPPSVVRRINIAQRPQDVRLTTSRAFATLVGSPVPKTPVFWCGCDGLSKSLLLGRVARTRVARYVLFLFVGGFFVAFVVCNYTSILILIFVFQFLCRFATKQQAKIKKDKKAAAAAAAANGDATAVKKGQQHNHSLATSTITSSKHSPPSLCPSIQSAN